MLTDRPIARFHYLTADGISGMSHAGLAEAACKGGVRWIQFRMKNAGYSDVLKEAKDVQRVCKRYNAVLIINDHVDVCRELHADGVHLGKEDMNPVEARKVLGDHFVIGATANSRDDIAALQTAPVDYIGLGPFRHTQTKTKTAPLLGFSIADYAAEFPAIPVVAIGGIRTNDAKILLEKGVYGIAVSGAVSYAGNIEKAAAAFLDIAGS